VGSGVWNALDSRHGGNGGSSQHSLLHSGQIPGEEVGFYAQLRLNKVQGRAVLLT